MEILRVLGFRSRDDGTLRYSRRWSLEASHLARLTLDLLLFADELRLYLTGGHPHPTHISDLFCPVSSAPMSPEPLGMQHDSKFNTLDSSVDFISAETTPVLDRKTNEPSLRVALNDFKAVDQSLKVTYNEQLHRQTSSEEDVTLHEDANSGKKESDISKTEGMDISQHRNSNISSQDPASDRASVSTDINSLPDLQTAPPSRMENFDEKLNTSGNSTKDNSVVASSGLPRFKDLSLYRGKKEDHVYEEIGEIRAQVQKLRASVSVPNLPPPLPPKSRSNDDDSSTTYSRGEWSAASSIGGSTGRRRRKRRAPLPPSFRQQESIKENLHASAPHAINKGRNPFYEEIGKPKSPLPVLEEKKDQEGKNPFYDTKPKPSGYIGANPFYEDVKKTKSRSIQRESTIESIEEDNTLSFSSSIDTQFDQSDEKSPPRAAIRPKRKAPSTPIPHSNSQSTQGGDAKCLSTSASECPISQNESKPLIRIPPDTELVDVDLHSLNSEPNKSTMNSNYTKRTETLSKNVNQKQLQSSQDVVSADLNGTESKEEVNIIGEPTIKDSHSTAKVTSQDDNTPGNQSLTKPREKGVLSETKDTAPRQNSIVSSSGTDETPSSDPVITVINTQTLTKSVEPDIGEDKDIDITLEASDNEQNSLADIQINSATTLNTTIPDTAIPENRNNQSRLSLLEKPLKLGDDLPYIDTTDVKNYKSAIESSSNQLGAWKPRNFARDSIPYIDDGSSAGSNVPPLLPPPPPPASPPPLNGDSNITEVLLSNSLNPPIAASESDISQFSKSDESKGKRSTISEDDQHIIVEDSQGSDGDANVRSLVIFGDPEPADVKPQRVTSGYYEIPQHPDQPPPLPAKPNNLRNTSFTEKVPDLPPKSPKLTSVYRKKFQSTEEERYEIPEVSRVDSLTDRSIVSIINVPVVLLSH